jgi:hypothetical protein
MRRRMLAATGTQSALAEIGPQGATVRHCLRLLLAKKGRSEPETSRPGKIERNSK